MSLENRVPFDLSIVEGAGHFSFMDSLPAQASDPLPDRKKSLGTLACEMGK